MWDTNAYPKIKSSDVYAPQTKVSSTRKIPPPIFCPFQGNINPT
jgi:hypothetical protein